MRDAGGSERRDERNGGRSGRARRLAGEDAFLPQLIGRVSYFYAIDNGEGAGADADIVSLVRAGDVDGEDQLFCDELPVVLPAREVVRGNVNISG